MPPRRSSAKPEEGFELAAAGPLRKLVSTTVPEDHKDDSPRPILYRGERLDTHAANSLVVLRRVAFLRVQGKGAGQTSTPDPQRTAARGRMWATTSRLGQEGASELIRAVRRRRSRFLHRWLTSPPESSGVGRHHRSLTLTTEWRVAVGLGDHYGVHESGVSLHGTYGFPVLPGSALGGLAAAAARADDDATPEDIHGVLGSPRPGETLGEDEQATIGSVRFLDALPLDVAVHDDVITPHQKPYYDVGNRAGAVGPGDHHQPEPASFLSLSGRFQVDLLGGNDNDLHRATCWLTWAGDNLGIGGRTTAGYGYFAIERSPTEHT